MFHDLNVPASLHSRYGDGALWEVARLGYDVVAFATTVTGKLGPEHLPPPHLRRSTDAAGEGEDAPVHTRGGAVGQYVRLPDGGGGHDTAVCELVLFFVLNGWVGLAFRTYLCRRWRLRSVFLLVVCSWFSGTDVVRSRTSFSGCALLLCILLAQILRLERRQPTGGTLLQLTRVTVEVNETADLTNLASPILAQYDIVAVRPATEKLLQQCMQFDFDILSLDLSARMPFFVKRPQSHVAAEKGVAFEIAYAGALCDGAPRRFLISNAVALVRALRGRNIVLTSAAASLLHLRGPYDVINLALLFNLDLQQARDAVVGTPAAVVQHACSRRSHKGFAYIAP